jgi:two-component system, NarL family, invasion response regulator UvrY
MPQAREASGAVPSSERHVRVLTVDDQERFRAAARILVDATPGFYNVAEASTGEDGVAAAMRQEIDLVLMDVRLPGIDGIEATRRVRHARPGTEVVLVSATATELPADASECGALAVLAKDELRPSVLIRLWERAGHGSPAPSG